MRGPTKAWRAVSWSMAAGAAFDLAFAVAILLVPGPASRALELVLPPDRVYLGLNGVLLLLLAAIYVLSVLDPVRYQGIVAVSACGRIVGCVYLAVAWSEGRPAAFVALAAADLLLALACGGLLLAARRDGTSST